MSDEHEHTVSMTIMTVDIAVNLRRDNDIERSIDDILGKFTKNAEYTGSVDVNPCNIASDLPSNRYKTEN